MGYVITGLVTAAVVFLAMLKYHNAVINKLKSTWAGIHTEYRTGILKAEQIPGEILARMKF